MLNTVLFLIYLLNNDVRAKNTLSTSSIAHNDIVRPTVSSSKWSSLSELVVKSINEQALYNESSLLRKYDYDSEERLQDLWNWDYWCKLQPFIGSCDKNIRKYYYDLKTELCKPINYSGCGKGKNLFSTTQECERTCVGANVMLKPSINLVEQMDCHYQPDPGLCIGNTEQLFYDVNLETCRTFIYGGCGGNANRFTSDAECLSNCGVARRRSMRGSEAIIY